MTIEVTNETKIDFVTARKELGDGPMRFAPTGERSIAEQIAALTEAEKKCFDNLKEKWEKTYEPFSDEMYLRFARCSPGKEKFNEKTAFKVMKSFPRRYLELNAIDLEKQLATKTLYPVPGLQTKDGHDLFFMYPARYFPKETSTKTIIDNLGYYMETMVEKEKACSEGIGFMAYMNNWKMENFSINYCYQFMMMLQGRVPVRVRLFLIVNPPGWFDKIWNIMKPMLAADFRKKVHVIPEADLPQFLMPGFESYLPDDADTGKAPSDEIVADFIKYRKYAENPK
ncbi:hypothetical protein FisN_6Hh359 [Fistulifera solaris]|uniref:CRAL-TRIO domain-containing protein n=1 Tax=Fistulifera solaris TaxID=1519565 RepID=A0A1Z5K7N8_FISSO|nr:hypothetical protein FisN_6Hh359 [Fistulifera solaris]|eukprot:GAX22111.1 hypothetical protein FisN_6Hh359 [Fistulifera solaris]